MKTKYLVIGVNASGFSALEEIRKHDSNGRIIAVNGENTLPYKRTKINKNFYPLRLDAEKIQLADSDWYIKNNITLINNLKITAIDSVFKTAELENKEKIYWEKLLLSTGAESFCPDISVFKNSYSIRTFEDTITVDNLIKSSKSCLIYGLGIESIETAAQLSNAGLSVTIAGRAKRLLSRYFSPSISLMVEQLLLSKNIDINYNVPIEKIININETNIAITDMSNKSVCIDGRTEIFDFLIYSLGISPKISLAEHAGLKIKKGIVVNERMETSNPNIYAAGDCAQPECSSITDHWHSAQDQGRTAAANMAGSQYKWPIKKYRLKMEVFGEYFFSMKPITVYDGVDIENSELSSRAFRLFYYRDNKLQAVEMVNDKERAKLYEKAVNEAWSKSEVDDILS